MKFWIWLVVNFYYIFQSINDVMMSTREPLEWHFKQLDHAVGLSFKSNFHFALVGHLLKGFRHTTPTTVSRTSRILTMLLGIVAKPMQHDKFEVSTESVAYLTGKSIFHFAKKTIFIGNL